MESHTSSTMDKGDNFSAELPHLMRITSSGKMRNWIEFALKFFQENESTPLVLHTLSPNQVPFLSPSPSGQTDLAGNNATTKGGEVVQPVTSDTANDKPTQARLDNATLLIPRLISVAEVIKREYLKTLPANRTEGLFQYNELGRLEDLPGFRATGDDGVNDGIPRGDALAAALEGKNYPKIKRTPYMKITLSRSPLSLPDDESKRITAQPAAKRKQTKSQKARLRKKQKTGHNSQQAMDISEDAE